MWQGQPLYTLELLLCGLPTCIWQGTGLGPARDPNQWADNLMDYTSETSGNRPFADALSRLRAAGLRPTRQRLALAKILTDGGDRHLTAEMLYEEAKAADLSISQATIYNTLHQFTEAGFLRQIVVDPGRAYFDTNVSAHHHFFNETTGQLKDIPGGKLSVEGELQAPEGTKIERADIIVRVVDA